MTKKELVATLSAKVEGLTKKDAELYINAVLDTITETLATGEEVNISGFGKFQVNERAERKGVNPQNKEEIIIPASQNVKFKSVKALKIAINQ